MTNNIQLCDNGNIALLSGGNIRLCCQCCPSELDGEYDITVTVDETATEAGAGPDGPYYCWGKVETAATMVQATNVAGPMCYFYAQFISTSTQYTELNKDCTVCATYLGPALEPYIVWDNDECAWYFYYPGYGPGELFDRVKLSEDPHDPTGTWSRTDGPQNMGAYKRCDWDEFTEYRKDTITIVISAAAP